jgi:ubiquinone/menaquinone biosynthesis C-methylase UbiE
MSSPLVNATKRKFLPAAGRDVFLPLYDPIVSLMGVRRARDELIKQANIQPDQRILDLGCGTGTLMVLLKRRYPSAQVVGIDPDANALRRAKTKARRAAVSVQLDEGFADELPYKEASFDRVISSFMFHHLEDAEREKTLAEVLRVLKPGGSFHLLDFVPRETDGFFARLFNSHARLNDNSGPRILRMMQHAGFTNEEQVKESEMLFGLLRIAYYQGRGRARKCANVTKMDCENRPKFLSFVPFLWLS